jgi:hypothetical protein
VHLAFGGGGGRAIASEKKKDSYFHILNGPFLEIYKSSLLNGSLSARCLLSIHSIILIINNNQLAVWILTIWHVVVLVLYFG